MTGDIRKLADDGTVAAPSPDARQVAYIPGSGSEIWLMGSKGEHPRRMASATPGDVFLNVCWSPDGARVAALKASGFDLRQSVIEMHDVGSGARAEILAEPNINAMACESDGRLIYVQKAARTQEESYGLWELTPAPGATRPAGAPRQVASWMAQSALSLSVSRDRTRVLVTRGRTRSNVFVGQLNATASTLSNVRELTHDDRVNWPSGWTPEGSAVLFHSDRNSDFDLFRQALTDREAQPVLLGPDEVRSARFTPDGKWILYLALVPQDPKVRAARVRLMRMPASGGPPEQVLEAAGNWGRGEPVCVDGDYGWSFPQFRCAAAARPAPCVIGEEGGPDQTVFTAVDPLRGRAGELARVDVPVGSLTWDLSPDGTRLALGSGFYVSGLAPVRILTLTDKAVREVPGEGRYNAASLSWSTAGSAVLLAHMTVRGSTLVSIPVDGGARTLLDLVGKGLYLTDPQPSPDGRQLAFGQATLGANAWLLEARQE